jgi:hypothetical protein
VAEVGAYDEEIGWVCNVGSEEAAEGLFGAGGGGTDQDRDEGDGFGVGLEAFVAPVGVLEGFIQGEE